MLVEERTIVSFVADVILREVEEAKVRHFVFFVGAGVRLEWRGRIGGGRERLGEMTEYDLPHENSNKERPDDGWREEDSDTRVAAHKPENSNQCHRTDTLAFR